MISPEGTTVLCMRVQCLRQKELADGNVGWLHRLGERVEVPRQKPKLKRTNGDMARTFKEWESNPSDRLSIFASSLSVSKSSLQSLQCVPTRWEQAWGFPMKTPVGIIVGIRIRAENGRKWAEPGGHEGLFIPTIKPTKRLLVCEGPTDTAAALTLGYWSIGRPNCAPKTPEINFFVERYRVREVVIVADKDEAGMNGALKLCDGLKVPSCILTLPTKDLRKFVECGGTGDLIESMIAQTTWRNHSS